MNTLRPTSAKVRQALFNILYSVEGDTFLDLFAGTGEIGITALKKGADKVVFVEKDRRRAGNIREKVKQFGDRATVVSRDAVSFLKNYRGKPFNVIFADPPYNYRHYDKLINGALEKLSEGGVFILEHRQGKHFGADEERKYGDTVLSLWRK
ncbi:MAG: methyltransferase [Aquificae bacterium]|nr:methyltransferase [Aquificota bacterium]